MRLPTSKRARWILAAVIANEIRGIICVATVLWGVR